VVAEEEGPAAKARVSRAAREEGRRVLCAREREEEPREGKNTVGFFVTSVLVDGNGEAVAPTRWARGP
jgi:hypothetical protein